MEEEEEEITPETLAAINRVLHMEQAAILRMPRRERRAAKQRIEGIEARVLELHGKLHAQREAAQAEAKKREASTPPRPPCVPALNLGKVSPPGGPADKLAGAPGKPCPAALRPAFETCC